MTNPLENLSSVWDDTFSIRQTEEHQEIERHKDLARQAVDNLYDEFLSVYNNPCPRQAHPPLVAFRQVNARAENAEKLLSVLLPAFRRQVASFSKAILDLCDAPIELVPKLELVAEVACELNSTMRQVVSCLCLIHPPGLRPEHVKDDQDFKKLKSIITQELVGRVFVCTDCACRLFLSTAAVIEHLGLSLNCEPERRMAVLTDTATCLQSIDQINEFINKSELAILRDSWQSAIRSMDESLERFVEYLLTHSRPSCRSEPRSESAEEDGASETSQLEDGASESAQPEDGASESAQSEDGASESSQPDDDSSENPQPIDRAPDVGTLIIVIIKLERLFFRKLLSALTNKRIFTVVIELSSSELSSLKEIPFAVSDRIVNLLDDMCQDPSPEERHARIMLDMRNTAQQLLAFPQLIVRTISNMFAPSRLNHDQPSPMIYFKVWFYQWNKHFFLAMRNFSMLLDSLQTIRA